MTADNDNDAGTPLDRSSVLQSKILSQSEALREFTVSIPMKVCVDGITPEEGKDLDILKFLERQYRKTRVYFDPVEFPVSSDGNPFASVEFATLQQSLGLAAGKSGIQLISNGGRGGSRAVQERIFKCAHSRHRKRVEKVDGDAEVCELEATTNGFEGNHHASDAYRTTSYSHDRKNNRRGGHRGKKRKTTTKVAADCPTCRFRFTVRYDSRGFYLVAGIGRREHNGHYRLIQECKKLRTSVINVKVQAILQCLAKNNVSDAALAAVAFDMSGVYISPGQVQYFRMDPSSGPRRLRDSSAISLSGEDDITKILRDAGCSYCCLFHTIETHCNAAAGEPNTDASIGDGDVSTISESEIPALNSEDSDSQQDASEKLVLEEEILHCEQLMGPCNENFTVKESGGDDDGNSEVDSDVSAYGGGDDCSILSIPEENEPMENTNEVVVEEVNLQRGGSQAISDASTNITPSGGRIGRSLVNEVNGHGENEGGQGILQLPAGENEDMECYAHSHRHKRQIPPSKDLLLGIAWVHPASLRIFQLFGRVVRVDCTSGTNNEQRPLLTCSTKDAMGHSVIFLRAFLPNERAWVFRWLFQEVFPILLGEVALKRITTMITDGDSQEISELDEAIRQFFPRVVRIRCGWHLVDRGMLRKFPGVGIFAGDSKKQTVWKRRLRTIRNWLFSFMLPSGCETREEYLLSKWLLYEFVKGNKVAGFIGPAHTNTILLFLKDNFFHHEARFSFYRRLNLLHYNEYSNSAHEGLNNGMKRSGAPVSPCHSLERSAKVQIDQTIRKVQQILARAQTELLEFPTWTTTKTSRHVVKVAEGELDNQRRAVTKLKILRCSPTEWKVTTISDDTNNAKPKTGWNGIPKFRRIRKVHVDETTGRLFCSCGHFARLGLPCRHQLAVIRQSSEETGTELPIGYINVTDVSVVWWAEYCALAGSSERNDDLGRTFEQLLGDDIDGPILPQHESVVDAWHGNSLVNHPSFELKHAKDRVMNYKHSVVDGVYQKYAKNERSNIDPTLTQETYIHEPCEQEDDSEESVGDGEEGTSAYCEYKPLVQEITSILDYDPDPEMRSEIGDYLREMAIVVKARAEQRRAKRGLQDNRRYASTSIQGINFKKKEAVSSK